MSTTYNKNTNYQRTNNRTNERSKQVALQGNYNNTNENNTFLIMEAINDRVLPRNPFIISKTLESVAGKMEDARTVERGKKYILNAKSTTQVQKLKKIDKLIDGTPIKIYEHPHLNKSKGVIFCEEAVDMSEEEIKTELAQQKVIEAKRITKIVSKNETSNTPIIILTFNATSPPEHIKLGLLRVRVKRFIPKPTLCFKCFRYGHISVNCKDATTCGRCSEEHQTEVCKNEKYCKNCKHNDHGPLNKGCPVYIKEQEIIKTKINNNISFAEARKAVNARLATTSYAGVSSVQYRLVNPPPTNPLNEVRPTQPNNMIPKTNMEVDIPHEQSNHVQKNQRDGLSQRANKQQPTSTANTSKVNEQKGKKDTIVDNRSNKPKPKDTGTKRKNTTNEEKSTSSERTSPPSKKSGITTIIMSESEESEESEDSEESDTSDDTEAPVNRHRDFYKKQGKR